MPLRPDFKLYINDEKIEERRIENPEKKFEIDDLLPKTGKVEGKIVYASSSLGKRSGIWVKVNGRVVNENRDPIDFKGMQGLLNRIYAEVEANGLQDTIRLDRESFDKTSEKWKEFSSFIEDKIRGPVEEYYLKKLRERDIKDFEEAKDEAVSDLEKMLESADVDENILPLKNDLIDEEEKSEVDEEKIRKELIEVEKKNGGKIKRPDSLKNDRPSNKSESKKNSGESSGKNDSGGASPEDDSGKVAGAFSIGEKDFEVKLWQGGKKGPESSLLAPGLIGINIDHPHFSLCKIEGPSSLRTNIRRTVLLPIAKAQESPERAFTFFDKLLRNADKLLSEEDYEKLGINIAG